MEKLRDIIEWNEEDGLYEKNLIEKVSQYERIVIFGAGIGGHKTLELLKKYGFENIVAAFSDNNERKIGTLYMSVPVISPNDLRKQGEKTLILVSSTAYDIIVKQLTELGVDKHDIYYFQPAGISLNSQEDKAFIKQHIDEFEKVYEILADEKSKKIFKCLLNYRISKNIAWLEEMKSDIDNEDGQYFDKDILKKYDFRDGFVDGGAYLGDTVEHFYTYFPNWKGKYFCIEAGKDICEHLEKKLKKMQIKNVTVYQYAMWSSKQNLCFDTSTYGDGAGSRVSDSGEEVRGIALDELLENETVDFIKMDIEGAEREALLGAEKIINKHRPILTVCVYHKPEDFFDIPLLIQSIVENEYEFYIRQYRYGQSETVLYAMPKSRLIGR